MVEGGHVARSRGYIKRPRATGSSHSRTGSEVRVAGAPSIPIEDDGVTIGWELAERRTVLRKMARGEPALSVRGRETESIEVDERLEPCARDKLGWKRDRLPVVR